jgi:flagellar hook-associated protein 2
MSTIDPTTWATQLATAYTQGTQGLITQQTKAATATSTALSTLKSALSAFSSTLSGLSTKKTLLANSATVSDSTKATASATASASAGTYSFFVKQLASAHQVMYSPVPSVSASGAGTLIISQAGGSSYSVDLSGADTDGDGAVSQTELARAINSATSGKVTASVGTAGGSSSLMLTAADTGAAGAISLDTSGVGDGTLAAALSSPTELAVAQDAIFNIGTETTGITVQQASNSYSGISGLSVTFSQAMASGSSPLTVSVAADNTAVTSKVQQFVDAYNAMRDKLDSLTATSLDSSKRGAFSTDAGVRSLKNTLASVLRQSFGGATLRDLGCDLAQGYLLDRPARVADLAAIILRNFANGLTRRSREPATGKSAA